MKKILIILTATLFITITAKGQNLFFFGENSYPCTETISLQSNGLLRSELNIVFAKDGTKTLCVLSTTAFTVLIRGKLYIYLDDGTVITCVDRENYDYVDNTASTVYSLTNEELIKMKNSNINTIRYTLSSVDDSSTPEEGDFTASNKGEARIDFPTLLTEFFEGKIKDSIENTDGTARNNRQMVEGERKGREEAERKAFEEQQRIIDEINLRSKGAFGNSGSGIGEMGTNDEKSQGVTFPGGNQDVPNGYLNAGRYGPGGSDSGEQDSGISYSLAGRSAKSLPKPQYPGNDEGIVVVKVTVDKYGKVTAAEPGVRGTNIMNQQFWNEAKQAALKAKFNIDENAPKFQQGTISYRFRLD